MLQPEKAKSNIIKCMIRYYDPTIHTLRMTQGRSTPENRKQTQLVIKAQKDIAIVNSKCLYNRKAEGRKTHPKSYNSVRLGLVQYFFLPSYFLD